MTRSRPTISDAEWQVMSVVWDAGGPTGSAEVVAALAEPTGWSPKTVQTLLGRLVKKGHLATEDVGGRYLYHPLLAREAAVREEGRSFLDRVFDGDAGALLLHFARSAELTEDEVAALRRALAQRLAEEDR